MTISITIDGHTADHVRAEMAKLLGVSADTPVRIRAVAASPDLATPFTGEPQPEGDVYEDVAAMQRAVMNNQNKTASEANAAAEGVKPTRERGKPSAGHARRTKAEIAEDDEAMKADLVKGIEAAGYVKTGEVNAFGAEYKKPEPVAAISTGEERLSPEDTPEDAAADAADEAVETAATKTDKLTVEDVRRTMGLYVNRYGMAAAQVDGQEVFKRVIGDSTMVDDKGNARGWRASDLPDDQAVLAKMVSGFEEMASKNPFKRDVVEKVA